MVCVNVIDKRFVHSPFKFRLPLPNAFYVHFTRWIHEMNLKDVGKLPSGVSGYIEPGGGHKLQTLSQIQFCQKSPTAVFPIYLLLFSILLHWQEARDVTTLLSFQKEKAKDFKSQIIRYLEAMLQSQQRVTAELF